MYVIILDQGGHVWEKQNTVTISKGGRCYDILKCKNCGMSGKTISLTSISLKGSYKEKDVYTCKNAVSLTKNEIKKIRIKFCNAGNPAFKNITPGSEHDVIDPPTGQIADHRGVWVMGVGEPVKILNHEYSDIS